MLLLALVWTFALHAHASNPSEPVPASVPAPAAVSASAKDAKVAASARKSAASSRSAHKRTVTVHKTVVRSTGKTTVTHKIVVGSPHKASPTHKASVTHDKTATTPHRTASSSHKAIVTPSTHAVTAPSSRSDSSAAKQHQPPAGQLAVEHELAQSKTVMLVFWNPKSSVDQEVHSQAGALVSGSKGTVVMHSALASQVNMFGSITEVVRVYQTPTILIVNHQGVVSTLTGLTEVFALQQAVREAQHASR